MLNKIASTNPMHCGTVGIDLEPLASDSNKNIATLAITTLLKTGTEATVERLMKSLTTFLNDIGDEFKIIVVDSMKSLCQKFPMKYGAVLHFLSETLREGGFEFKQVIIDVIISIIEQHPDATDEGLLQLCEVIEDCEYTVLCQRILNFIGRVGPTTNNPNKYIRYINNRISLESPVVRAASVSALAKFGAFCPALRSQIVTLLKRATQDTDDEVRDRAVWYSSLL
jgi:coatomer protein complex subunit gamma